MRTRLIFLFILLFTINLSAQREYDLGEKKVIGEDKREYHDEVNIIKKTNSKQDKNNNDIKIKLKEEKIDIHDKEERINLKGNSEDHITLSSRDSLHEKKNHMLFGSGGFKRIDSFHYAIDYTKNVQDKDLTYFLHIDRYIRGEDRDNSDIDSDQYIGKIWYKRFSLSLSHLIKDENLPAQKESTSQVSSFKNEKTSQLNTEFNIYSGQKRKLNIGMGIYSQNISSLPTIQRNYKNNLYDFYISYDTLFRFLGLKNYTLIKALYYRDNMPDDKISCIKIDTTSKIKVQNDRSLSFDLKTSAEYLIRNKVNNENNYLLLIGMNKYLNKYLFIGANIEQENSNKLSKDLFNNFEFDHDILPMSGIKHDNNFTGEIKAGLNTQRIFLQFQARHHHSKDKIIYEEDYSFPDETAIHIVNYDQTIKWQEIECKFSTLVSIFKGEIRYIYSNLENIPFIPQNKFILNLIFNFKRLTNRIEGKYYTKMYGLRDNENALPDYRTIDLYNTYKFSNNLAINLNVLNLINSDSQKKTGYLMDQRKIMLEFQIMY